MYLFGTVTFKSPIGDTVAYRLIASLTSEQYRCITVCYTPFWHAALHLLHSLPT